MKECNRKQRKEKKSWEKEKKYFIVGGIVLLIVLLMGFGLSCGTGTLQGLSSRISPQGCFGVHPLAVGQRSRGIEPFGASERKIRGDEGETRGTVQRAQG